MKLYLSDIKLSKYDVERKINLPNKIDKNLAYICGILAGDGHIPDRKGDYDISCGGNPNDEIKFYDIILKNLIKKLFNYQINNKLRIDGTYGFRIGSKAIHTYLTKKIGLPKGKKYSMLKIPIIFKLNEDLIKNYILGLADTDFGFVLKKRYKKVPYYPVMSLNSKSKKFTCEIQKKLIKYGLSPTKVYKNKIFDKRTKLGYTETYRFELNGHKQLKIWIKNIGLFKHPKNLIKINKWISRNDNILARVGLSEETPHLNSSVLLKPPTTSGL